MIIQFERGDIGDLLKINIACQTILFTVGATRTKTTKRTMNGNLKTYVLLVAINK